MPTPYTLEDIAHLSVSNTGSEKPSDQGKAFLAVSAGMVWPGLGHVFAGDFKWAGRWCGFWCCILAAFYSVIWDPTLLPIVVVLLPLAIVVQFAQLLHAAHCGRRSNGELMGDVAMRFGIGAFFALVGLAECYGTISFVQANWIEICYSPTPSMSPNVSPGDLFINFKNEPFTRWDIVAVDTVTGSNPENGIMHLCKRVVGLPGEQVEITGAGLLIDGKLTAVPNKVGPYAAVDFSNNPLMDAEPMAAANGCWGRPMKLGPDEYFLLGDNSSLSDDGRFWPSMDDHQPGATPRSQIKGRVVGIVWPLARWRMFDPAAPRTEK